MSKCVLLSVRPQYCELIANGKKTIEVRKTRPKLETPFKCYIYQTKPKDRLITIMRDGDENYGEIYHGKPVFIKTYGEGYWTGRNQKVIGEFVCDEITTDLRGENTDILCNSGCLTLDELKKYGGNNPLYGWHISDLQIYDKPRELSEFYFPPEKYCEKELCGGCPHDQMPDVNGEYAYDCEWRRPITRAPQSWCYVEEYDGKR